MRTMLRKFALTLLAVPVLIGLSGGSAFAAITTNLNPACTGVNPVVAFHHSASGPYWAHVEIQCRVDYMLRFEVKRNGVVFQNPYAVYGPSQSPLIPSTVAWHGDLPDFTATKGASYQIVVIVTDSVGRSLGYATSGAPQILVR